MTWWRKVVFGAIGLSLAGPLGGLIGLAIGHVYDKNSDIDSIALETERREKLTKQEERQAFFFATTFSVMGVVAKADGLVTKEEIRIVEKVLREFDFAPNQREYAIALFNRGKDPRFDFWGVIDQFKDACPRQFSLYRMFLSIQVQMALSDGDLSREELSLLQRIAKRLGISVAEFNSILEREKRTYYNKNRTYEKKRRAHEQRQQRSQEQKEQREKKAPPPRKTDSLTSSYRILGVLSDVSDAEVKLAYRRMMNQYHPDKLAARGLPEEMFAAATEKAKEIQGAWVQIKKARDL